MLSSLFSLPCLLLQEHEHVSFAGAAGGAGRGSGAAAHQGVLPEFGGGRAEGRPQRPRRRQGDGGAARGLQQIKVGRRAVITNILYSPLVTFFT